MAYGCTFYEKAMRLRRLSWKEIRGNNRWQLRIGKTAQIDPNVIFELGDEAKPTEVGDGCKILSGSVISYGCKLGLGVFINFNTTLLPDVQIGNRTNIGPNTVIESHVSIGEICSIRANCYIPSFTVIEDRVFIAAGVTFANDRTMKYHRAGHGKNLRGPRVKSGARIGVGATILPDITVGENAVVGAQSLVTHDVPSETVVYGVPAKEIRKVKKEDVI